MVVYLGVALVAVEYTVGGSKANNMRLTRREHDEGIEIGMDCTGTLNPSILDAPTLALVVASALVFQLAVACRDLHVYTVNRCACVPRRPFVTA